MILMAKIVIIEIVFIAEQCHSINCSPHAPIIKMSTAYQNQVPRTTSQPPSGRSRGFGFTDFGEGSCTATHASVNL